MSFFFRLIQLLRILRVFSLRNLDFLIFLEEGRTDLASLAQPDFHNGSHFYIKIVKQ